jgi:hypothetical protein
MLPEHVNLLREYNDSLDKVEKPVLDEQKYDEFNEVIYGAIEENITFNLLTIKKGK